MDSLRGKGRGRKIGKLTLFWIFIICTVWSSVSAEDEVASDGTVAAEPQSVVPAGSPPLPPPVQAAPALPAPYSDVSGTTTETKNPDGSTIRVTHFKGGLPPQHNPFYQPYGGAYPGWGGPSPYYPWGFPQQPPPPGAYHPGAYNPSPNPPPQLQRGP